MFHTFHLLTVGSLQPQGIGSDVIVTVVIVLDFVIGLSRSAILAGLDDMVRFLIKLSKYPIALLISVVIVTRFLKVI